MGDIYALVSAGGAPGVTTAALAMALTWPGEVIVAECDPAGGDILAGLLTGHVPASKGLMEHAIQAGRDAGAAATALSRQLVPLGTRHGPAVLPGVTDPRQSPAMASAWPAVAAGLAAQPADVIADCGRLDAGAAQPLAVLAAAAKVAVVLRPTLRQVWTAQSRVDILSHQLPGGLGQVVLLVTGRGTHTPQETGRALGLPVAAVLPHDPRAAALLSDGVGHRSRVMAAPLLRAARGAGSALRDRSPVMAAAGPE